MRTLYTLAILALFTLSAPAQGNVAGIDALNLCVMKDAAYIAAQDASDQAHAEFQECAAAHDLATIDECTAQATRAIDLGAAVVDAKFAAEERCKEKLGKGLPKPGGGDDDDDPKDPKDNPKG